MPNSLNHDNLHELDFRLQRVKKQIVITELKYEMAVINHKPMEILEDLNSDLENLRRKQNWFSGAISRYASNR